MNDAWYVAEPDGETWGPYAQSELLRAAAAGQFAADSLVWHAELGEWQALSRHVSSTSSVPAKAPVEPDKPRVATQTKRSSKPSHQPRAETVSRPPPMPVAADELVAFAKTLKQNQPLSKATLQVAQSQASQAGARIVWVGKRGIARYIDVFSYGLLGAVVIQSMNTPASSFDALPGMGALLFLALALCAVVEVVLIGLFGTTPGKWMMGLDVRDKTGKAPGFARAAKRSFSVYARGLGLGLVFLLPFTLVVALVQTLGKGEAPWDHDLVVGNAPLRLPTKAVAVIMFVLWFAAIEDWWIDMLASLMR